jgi:hypothetical protein
MSAGKHLKRSSLGMVVAQMKQHGPLLMSSVGWMMMVLLAHPSQPLEGLLLSAGRLVSLDARGSSKESHTFLLNHLSNEMIVRLLSRTPYLGNGEAAFTKLREICRVGVDARKIEDLQDAWKNITIKKDIGSNENSIQTLSTVLDAANALIPTADQFNDDQKAVKILRELTDTSSLFSLEANTELNAPAGTVGTPALLCCKVKCKAVCKG